MQESYLQKKHLNSGYIHLHSLRKLLIPGLLLLLSITTVWVQFTFIERMEPDWFETEQKLRHHMILEQLMPEPFRYRILSDYFLEIPLRARLSTPTRSYYSS
jgi:hypothetical protein